MCAHVHRDTELNFFLRLLMCKVSSQHWPQPAVSGALLFLGAVSKDGFSNMRGSWAAISVRRKGWKWRLGWGSSSLSIKVGIDLWQLSIKVCESRPTRWEIGFPSPGEDEWPQEKKEQEFRTQLPEKNRKTTISRFGILQPFLSQLNPFAGSCMQSSWKIKMLVAVAFSPFLSLALS